MARFSAPRILEKIMRENPDSDWRFVIAPNRGGALGAVVGVWVFCGIAAWLFSHAAPEWGAWALVVPLPFALLITWFGLRTWLYGAGTITLFRQGFSISDGQHERLRRTWDQVGEFFVGKAFRSPIYQGRESPHVRFVDGAVDWLPQNAGYDAAGIVAIMEGARRLAAAGWPHLPETAEALGAWSRHRPEGDDVG